MEKCSSHGINQFDYFSEKSSGFLCAVKMIEKQLIIDEDIVEQFIR